MIKKKTSCQNALISCRYYKYKVASLILLGNLYIILMLAIIAAILVGTLTLSRTLFLNVMPFLGVFLWLSIKSLWIKSVPPKGIEINQQDVPEIFSLVNKLRLQLNLPRIHHILITDDLNAAISQIPRLGWFGGYKNYLLIGYPMLACLSVSQFRAVLAHELGHLSHGDGKIGGWVYRHRQRWQALQDLLNSKQGKELGGRILFKPFFDRFIPFFLSYSFPMARQMEYAADSVSVKLTDIRATTEALTATEIFSRYLNIYWTNIFSLIECTASPDEVTPYHNLKPELLKKIDDQVITQWQQEAMNQETERDDTHPSLKDRLNHIKGYAEFNPPNQDTYAATLLGTEQEKIVGQLDSHWRSNINNYWQEKYDEFSLAKKELHELESISASSNALSLEQNIQLAHLIDFVRNDEHTAKKILYSLYDENQKHALLCYGLGVIELRGNNHAGCALLEQSMITDEWLTKYCCEHIYHFFIRIGDATHASIWKDKLLARTQLEQLANHERSFLRQYDKLQDHQLSDMDLATLLDFLKHIPELQKVWFAKKQVEYLPHVPCYVLAFTTTGLFQLRNKERMQRVTNELHKFSFPHHIMFINLDVDGRSFKRLLKKRLIFRKEK